MRTRFKFVFGVQVLHTYFEGDICTCLQLRPTAATADVMARYQLKMNDRINGFEFYSGSIASLSESLQHIQRTTGLSCFEFDLINNDMAFYCFTALPMNRTVQLLYDSASVTSIPESKTLLLTETIEAVDSTAIAGKLKVRFADLIKYTGDLQTVNFEISYTARETQWKYYVVNRNALDLNNPAIRGKSDINFRNEGIVTIETGEKALLFSSGDQLLALSKFPKYKFDLVNLLKPPTGQPEKRTASKVIIKGLPDPDPSQIQAAFINAKTQVSSPIYIYV